MRPDPLCESRCRFHQIYRHGLGPAPGRGGRGRTRMDGGQGSERMRSAAAQPESRVPSPS